MNQKYDSTNIKPGSVRYNSQGDECIVTSINDDLIYLLIKKQVIVTRDAGNVREIQVKNECTGCKIDEFCKTYFS